MAWFCFVVFMTVLAFIALYVNPNIMDKRGNTDTFLLYATMLWLFVCFLSLLGFLYAIVWVYFLMTNSDGSSCGPFVAIGFIVGVVPMIVVLKKKFK